MKNKKFNFNKKDFCKIFELLCFFYMNTGVICKIYLEFLQMDISVTQTLQIFSVLDTIDDMELVKLIDLIFTSKVYLKTLKNESLLKYLIKFIKLLQKKKSPELLFFEILDQIVERDIFIAFFKVVQIV